MRIYAELLTLVGGGSFLPRSVSTPKGRSFNEDQALKGRRAQRWHQRGKNMPSNSRQSRRYRLRAEANEAVAEANLNAVSKKLYIPKRLIVGRPHEGVGIRWEIRPIKLLIGMPRGERRKLAKAYFAGEWKQTHAGD